MLPYGVGGLLVLIGGVWLLQGLGLLKGSFMTGSAFWAVTGAVCITAGVGLSIYRKVRASRQSSNPPQQ